METGIGPICRQKYGYDARTGETDVPAAKATLVAAGCMRDDWAWMNLEPRAIANQLIHAFARLGDATADEAKRVAYAIAIGQLGFVALANKLAAVTVRNPVVITLENNHYVVNAPFNEAFNAARRQLGGAYFHAGTKRHVVPANHRQGLWNAIARTFPKGTVVTGPKGVKTL